MTAVERGGSGPVPANIVAVGEAYGSEEARYCQPFVGSAGQELRSWLKAAGLDPSQVHYTNVINKRPPSNDFGKFCLSKKQAKLADPDYSWPPIASGKYLAPEHCGQVEGLLAEIRECQPNLVLALGNTACWALLGQTGISKLRGALAWSSAAGAKCLPMLHPAAILRQYENRPLALADAIKAVEESKTLDFEQPTRELWLDPEIEDLPLFDHEIRASHYIGLDIETAPSAGMLRMVGLSAGSEKVLVVPFYDPRSETGSYWTAANEALAWGWIERWLTLPIPKVLQNAAYDLIWLWSQWGLQCRQWEDTLLQAHSQQPELPKDLATLGSLYTREAAWKLGQEK